MRDLLEHRRLVITITLLYLSQGIPIGIAMDAMPTLLRHDGAPLHALAFLPLVGLPWVVKFLWAPVVDNRWSRGSAAAAAGCCRCNASSCCASRASRRSG